MTAKIAIITYSTYGHINQLADLVEEGVKSSGAIVTRFQLPETLSEEVLSKMHAPPKNSYTVLKDPQDLKEFDGFLFGFPTRYGRAPAQVSSFFDTTGGLWMTGALVGKFAGIFTSTAGQHGGHETTALTTLPFLAHHGIIYVPIGYANPNLNDNTELLGGAPWGASTIAGGDGSRKPNSKELDIAKFQGQEFGKILNRYVAGK
ncbi:flavoprotein-like protein [Phakopsora pachyrhizi]|uniref:Flavo protein-like protein n=1 Tax=Phakopsora pachyrhizi TaxID=170000 RepID=A0AAV0B196_PHAPC|nr:flavoprotein-like protein [Phakopsora pachyrhizi]CAH7674592.1 flavo protein-like protein [Phakopsora pachyrhizi]